MFTKKKSEATDSDVARKLCIPICLSSTKTVLHATRLHLVLHVALYHASRACNSTFSQM